MVDSSPAAVTAMVRRLSVPGVGALWANGELFEDAAALLSRIATERDEAHAAGVAEGLATAAAIARAAAKAAAEKHNARPNRIAREEYAGAWKQALDIGAILAAAPPHAAALDKAPE